MLQNSIKMNTLASLAMLKTNINLEKDYLSNLEPYILYTLSKNKHPFHITDSTISKELRDLCGLKIPTRTVQVILQRLARQGYLFKEGKVFKAEEILEKENFSEKFEKNRKKVSSSIDEIIEDIQKFALSEYNINLTSDETTSLIFNFLSRFCIPFLESFIEGNALPDFEKKGRCRQKKG